MRYGGAVHFAGGCQLRAGVEAEPAEPEDEHTERGQSEVVARDGAAFAILAVFVQTRTKSHGTYQG